MEMLRLLHPSSDFTGAQRRDSLTDGRDALESTIIERKPRENPVFVRQPALLLSRP